MSEVLSRVMLVTHQLRKPPVGGRELLCELNHDALREIYGARLILMELPTRRVRGPGSFINAFKGHIDGLDAAFISSALRTIKSENVDKVFIDGSNLGGLVKVIKKKLPLVEVSTFFHNVESRFFLGSMRNAWTVRAVLVLVVNYLAERKTARHSDKIICLSKRDSRLLEKIYGRSATHISPIALQDRLPREQGHVEAMRKEPFALFVGGIFYANRIGIAWFVKHVVPRIGIKTYVVGKGFEKLKSELERDGKVVVVGAVDSLSQWYLDSKFVVAPIFDGSGMKTKVAEALMYGKRIIGTPEAFSGYMDVASRAGAVCTTADDFVAAIERAKDEQIRPFDPELRAIYEERYSYPAARNRLAEIMGSDQEETQPGYKCDV